MITMISIERVTCGYRDCTDAFSRLQFIIAISLRSWVGFGLRTRRTLPTSRICGSILSPIRYSDHGQPCKSWQSQEREDHQGSDRRAMNISTRGPGTSRIDSLIDTLNNYPKYRLRDDFRNSSQPPAPAMGLGIGSARGPLERRLPRQGPCGQCTLNSATEGPGRVFCVYRETLAANDSCMAERSKA